jgi:hypothetical protein
LREELNIGDSFSAAASNKYEGLLEKKWTGGVRLLKRVGFHGRLFRRNAELSLDNETRINDCEFTSRTRSGHTKPPL